jgi:hypothetical protein
MMFSLRWGAISAAALMAASTAQAALLSDLLQGGTITIGDKVFADFTYDTACGPAPDEITVVPWDPGQNVYGICIQGPLAVSATARCDIGLSYTVTVVPGSPWWIHDLYQSFTPTWLGNGGAIGIGEVVRMNDALGPILGISSVGWVGATQDLGDPPPEADDHLVFSQYAKRVFVSKDIWLQAADPNSAVGATVIYQGFSQIPEPALGALFAALGLLGFGLCRRR